MKDKIEIKLEKRDSSNTIHLPQGNNFLNLKILNMKKVLAMFAIAGVLVACNNDADGDYTTDTTTNTTITTDTNTLITPITTDTTNFNDTTRF